MDSQEHRTWSMYNNMTNKKLLHKSVASTPNVISPIELDYLEKRGSYMSDYKCVRAVEDRDKENEVGNDGR